MPTYTLPYTTSVKAVLAGDIIVFKGIEYYVKKVNPKNLRIVRISDGTNYNLPRAAAWEAVARQLTDDERKTCGILTWSEKQEVKAETGLRMGAIVMVKPEMKPKKASWKYDNLQKFVVIDDRKDYIKVVPVGGSTTGTWWGLQPKSLEVVDL